MEWEPKQIILKLDLTECGSNKEQKWHQEDVQAIQQIYYW